MISIDCIGKACIACIRGRCNVKCDHNIRDHVTLEANNSGTNNRLLRIGVSIPISTSYALNICRVNNLSSSAGNPAECSCAIGASRASHSNLTCRASVSSCTKIPSRASLSRCSNIPSRTSRSNIPCSARGSSRSINAIQIHRIDLRGECSKNICNGIYDESPSRIALDPPLESVRRITRINHYYRVSCDIGQARANC